MKTLNLSYKTTVLALMMKSHLLWHMGNDHGIIDVIFTDLLEIGKTRADIFRIDLVRLIPGLDESIKETFGIAFTSKSKLIGNHIDYGKIDSVEMHACYHIDRFGDRYAIASEIQPNGVAFKQVAADDLFSDLTEFLDVIFETQLPYVHQDWDKIKEAVYSQHIDFLYDAACYVQAKRLPASIMMEPDQLAGIVFDALRYTNTYTGKQQAYFVDRSRKFKIIIP